jgi:predicted metalloprotease with PDZ domain
MNELIYRVDLLSPGAHLFRVSLVVPKPNPGGQELCLPAWIPGSYMIRDFARNIVTLDGECGGSPVVVTKLDKQTWRVAPCAGTLTIRYDVYAWDLSVRGAHFDTTHAYFNGASLFLDVPGCMNTTCLLELPEPAGEYSRNWAVETSLPSKRISGRGFGVYGPLDYEELLDHPVEIGDLSTVNFDVQGVPHRIAVYGRQRGDLGRLARDLRAVCQQHVDLFGALPLERYLFLIMAIGQGYGGLEHKDSSSLICARADLPSPDEPSISEGYRRFLGLCSHEYFHLWNVKRIRPDAFKKGSLGQEVYTRLLWVFEGFTSYYDDLALVRSGLIDERSYLHLLSQTITRVMRGSGRLKQSVADSSFDAWTKFYKQDGNSPNAIVSYYAKGALVALALDLILRRDTDGRCTLDHIMRALWRRFGETGRGVPEGELEHLVEEVSGLDLRDFFSRAVYGTEDLPLTELLNHVGVILRMRPAKDASDLGGYSDQLTEVKAQRALGVRLQEGVEALISHVLDGGVAQEAGIASGDLIIAVDGLRANASNLTALINRVPECQAVEIHLFRRDELMRFEPIPRQAPDDTCELILAADMAGDATNRRARWLSTG